MGDLTSVGSVKDAHRIVGTDAFDELIARYIVSASVAITRWSGREFTPTEADEERRYAMPRGETLYLSPYDLRTLTSIVVDPEGEGRTLTDAEYRLRPLPASEGVYEWIELPRLREGQTLAIMGAWGFPAVPPDVDEACVDTVREWLRSSQAVSAGTPDLEEPGMPPARALTLRARWLLLPYQRMALA